MLVYRLEHRETRLGPYNPGWAAPDADREALADAMNSLGMYERIDGDEDPHPTPKADGIDEFTEHVHFSAFASTKALLDWFGPRSVPAFARANYIVARYLVASEDVQLGTRQVAFVRERARLLPDDCPTSHLLR